MENPFSAPTSDTQSRRKSGRQVQKPVLFQQDPNIQPVAVNGSAKRKRGTLSRETNGAASDDADDSNDNNNNTPPEDSSEEEDEGESDEPDEEELKENRRRARARKPAAKKPRVLTNDAAGVQLAMRPAAANGVHNKKNKNNSNRNNVAAKPRRPRPRPVPQTTGRSAPTDEGTGLYNEVFAQSKSADEVATHWLTRYSENPVETMRDFVNFVLRSSGCSLEVDVHDVEDVDNVPGKLEDLQDEFLAQKVADYPLIAKSKGSVFSRVGLNEFIKALLEAAHQSEVLYKDTTLIENMQVWVTTMSSSAARPFRHTATVIGLALGSALCDLHQQLVNTIATTTRQKEGEQKRKTANKERVKALQAKIREEEGKKSNIETWIKEIFDGIFVHRYRDVDPRIRVDCASVLGHWIYTCPDMFFLAEYLRYLGWVLSDVVAGTRAEVLKQLSRLYKQSDNAGRLRAFTDRFKSRMLEMACQDSEPSVRAAAIDLLEIIRGMGFLDPEDVDVVGKLIFDSEPRVRKAVTNFFAANIDDVLEATVEELGGNEVLSEALGEEADEDYEQPKRSWLKYKALAETLELYDADDADAPEAGTATAVLGADSHINISGGTRFSLAGEIACNGIPEVKEWESLAGYLLYDFSVSRKEADDDSLVIFKRHCQPNEKQESILLEILQVAVRMQLEDAVSDTSSHKKKPKARAGEGRAIQESTAQTLGQLLPKLLGKFGSTPGTVIAVLRLEQLLNLDIFQELRQGSTKFAKLLDDISRQFMTHADSNVLQAARDSLLHARQAEEFAEVTDTKVEEVWIDALKPLQQAAASNSQDAKTLANAVERIANLASIADCVELFERELPHSNSKRKSATSAKSIEDYLSTLITAYADTSSPDGERILLGSMQALLFYTMWKIKDVELSLGAGEAVDWSGPTAFPIPCLVQLIEARPPLDDIRLAAIGVLLDAHLVLSSVRQIEADNADVQEAIAHIVRHVTSDAKKAITASFVAAEKDYAKKSHRRLDADEPDAADGNGEADAPASEPESEDDDEDEESDDPEDMARAQRRKHELLRSERRLCELTGKIVLAIAGRVLDVTEPGRGKLRKRIQRNKTRLGGYFKEVLGYLDEPKAKPVKSRAKTPAVNGAPLTQKKDVAAATKSKEIVEETDEDEVQDGAMAASHEDDGVEGDEDDLRRKGVLEDGEDDGIEATGPDKDDDDNDDDDDDPMGD